MEREFVFSLSLSLSFSFFLFLFLFSTLSLSLSFQKKNFFFLFFFSSIIKEERLQEKALKREQIRVDHPNFRPIDHEAAEKELENADIGDYIVRPSSKGIQYLTISWKVAKNLVDHIREILPPISSTFSFPFLKAPLIPILKISCPRPRKDDRIFEREKVGYRGRILRRH